MRAWKGMPLLAQTVAGRRGVTSSWQEDERRIEEFGESTAKTWSV